MKFQDLSVDKGSGYQGGNINGSGSCSAYLMVHFDHPVAKVFDVFPGLVPETHFLQVLDKRADSGRIDLLLILYDDAKDLGPRGVVPKAFLNGSSDLERDGCKHILSAPRDIVAVKVADREKMSSSITEPCSCKGLGPLRNFPLLRHSPVI